jgi:hypothetical protein
MDEFFGFSVTNNTDSTIDAPSDDVLNITELNQSASKKSALATQTKKRGRPKSANTQNKKSKKDTTELTPYEETAPTLQVKDVMCTIMTKYDRMFEYQLYNHEWETESVKTEDGYIELPVIRSYTYPQKSDKPCPLCGRNFDNIPIPMILGYDYVTKRFRLDIKLMYCGPGCCKRAISERKTFNAGVLIMHLHKLAREHFGIRGAIPMSRPSRDFKIHGGTIDPYEYHKGAPQYQIIIEPPFINHSIISAIWREQANKYKEITDNSEAAKQHMQEQEKQFWNTHQLEPVKKQVAKTKTTVSMFDKFASENGG